MVEIAIAVSTMPLAVDSYVVNTLMCDLYSAYMDQKQIDARGIAPAKKDLKIQMSTL